MFSLTSVFVPQKKSNLAAFMSVGRTRRTRRPTGIPDPVAGQHPGARTGQIANQFQRDDKVASQLLAFKRADVTARYGNLLTLPVGGGLLYVQPLYTVREGGSGNYPGLTFVLVSFGNEVGIGPTLSAALQDVLDATSASSGTGSSGSTDTGRRTRGRQGPRGRRAPPAPRSRPTPSRRCSRPTRSSPTPTRR